VGVVETEVVVDVPPAHPVGTVQVYDVEFVTAAMLKEVAAPMQGCAEPLMRSGCVGVLFGVTASVRGTEEPQILFAVTVMLPAAEPAVALSVAVLEVPAQPVPGVVQV
jgi:hypothetical protein